jgi:hypothetical protein
VARQAARKTSAHITGTCSRHAATRKSSSARTSPNRSWATPSATQSSRSEPRASHRLKITTAEFVSFFCASHRGCTPGTEVNPHRMALPRRSGRHPHARKDRSGRNESPMTVSGRPAGAAAFFLARAEVKLAWGVDLHASQSGELHASVAGTGLTGPFRRPARPGGGRGHRAARRQALPLLNAAGPPPRGRSSPVSRTPTSGRGRRERRPPPAVSTGRGSRGASDEHYDGHRVDEGSTHCQAAPQALPRAVPIAFRARSGRRRPVGTRRRSRPGCRCRPRASSRPPWLPRVPAMS